MYGFFARSSLNSSRTHIVAPSDSARSSEWSRMRIVNPEWITESISKGIKLDWRDYECILKDKDNTNTKAKTSKNRKVQSKIKFSKIGPRTDLLGGSSSNEPITRKSKNEGFGLDLIAQRELSPTFKKTDTLGQLGKRLFGLDERKSMSPTACSRLLLKPSQEIFEGEANRRSLSPEKFVMEFETLREEETTPMVFPPGNVEETSGQTRQAECHSTLANPDLSRFNNTLAHHPSLPTLEKGSTSLSKHKSISDPTSSDKTYLDSTIKEAYLKLDAETIVPGVCIAPPAKGEVKEPAVNMQRPLQITEGTTMVVEQATDSTTAEQIATVPSYASHSSNPYASAAMKSNTFRQTRTSVSDNFIKGFYQHSRLHYLSTWKAELKNIVAEAHEHGGQSATESNMNVARLQNEKPKTWDIFSREKQKERDRCFMHCDFDSFFVAVGLLDRSQLRGKPVVVCHSQGETGGASSTSEIASASYEARDFGIRNGMR